MKRILFDTNIILDIALKREFHFTYSSKLFEFIDLKLIIGYITATTITDIYYISKREKGDLITREFIMNMIEIFEVIGVDKSTIQKALTSDLNDFEDAVQVSSALQYELDAIVTRNKSDFINSNIEVFTAVELIENLT